MRKWFVTLAFAALMPMALASDVPERLTSRPAPVVKLKSSDGWRLSGVANMDVERGIVVLLVEGDVFNVSARERPSPTIRLALRDREGSEKYHWTVMPDQPRIKPGDYASFSTKLEQPPDDAITVGIEVAGAD